MDNMENRLKRMRIEGTPVDETLRRKTRHAAAGVGRPAKMRWMKPAVIAAVAVVVAVVMLLTLAPFGQTRDDSFAVAQISAVGYITLDINPSIQLTVEQGVITAVQGLNDDGTNIMLVTDVIGMTPLGAVDVLVGELIAQGYITEDEEAALVITVSGCDEEGLVKGLKECAKERIREMDGECEVVLISVSPEDVEAAQALSLSVGRYLILNYIAQLEGITIEEAITQYGSMRIDDLMDLFEDIEDLFDEDDDKDDKLDEDELPGLTAEQHAIIIPALETFKRQIKEAEFAFHNEFKAIKESYVETIKSLRQEYKGQDEVLQEVLDQLKSEMIQERKAALAYMFGAIDTAKSEFLSAVADTGIPQDVLVAFLNEVVAREVDTQDEYNDFLSEFRVEDEDDDRDDEDKDDEDKDDDKDDEDEDDDRDDEDEDDDRDDEE